MASPSKLKDRVDQAKQTQALSTPTSTVLGIFQDARIKTQLAAALGSHVALSPDRLLVVALNECRRNPKLLTCTRESFVAALMTAAHLGLEVGGLLGHFYLVPFKNTNRGTFEVTPILGYKGMIVLARRSKEIEDVVARPVYEADHFEFSYGIEDRLVHVPAEGDRGKVIKFYGLARFTNGGHLLHVMSRADVDHYRARSKAKNDGPWVTDYEAMGSKTNVRRMAPYLPLTTEAAEAIAEDEERELGLTPEGVLDLDALGFPDGKSLKAPAVAVEGGDGKSKEQPSATPPSTAPAVQRGVVDGVETTITRHVPDPTVDPAAEGSILKDPPVDEDPGAAFRRP